MTEQDEIEYDPEHYQRPSVTVDTILFSIQAEKLATLLVRRGQWPHKGMWAIPGGFIHLDETLEECARRKLAEETGVSRVYLEQLYTFGEVDRDPRTRVITVAYFALVDGDRLKRVEPTRADILERRWFSMKGLPELAFDHGRILDYALRRLRYKLEYTAVGLELLPELFTLTELQGLYEAILDEKLDRRNFRKKIAGLNILDDSGQQRRGSHRPARLYRFRRKVLLGSGFKKVTFEG